MTAKSVIESGLLGNLVELNSTINFRPGPETWRGWKEKSGGILFDWGSHLTDYVLHLADSEVVSVSGFFYRSPKANPALNEDHGSVSIRFKSGAIGNVTIYGTGRAEPLRYNLVGDRGTLTDEWHWDEKQKVKVFTRMPGGEHATMEVGYQRTVPQKYYDNIAAHMTEGVPLMVSAESAAKIINIFCTAERSHAKGGVPLPLEK